MSKIFIPAKIRVGFQSRKDTYTGKLAYIIYYDATGKLRKEASWKTWRSDEIAPEEFDNTPQKGFVINKGIRRYNWSHFGSNRSYIRVYDPRGIEFEITPENLVGILTETDFLDESEVVSEQTVHNTSVGTEGDKWSWDSKNVLYVIKNHLQFSDKEVRDVATSDLAIVTTKTPVKDCANKMRQRNIEQLPVIDVEGDLVGLVAPSSPFQPEARGDRVQAVHGHTGSDEKLTGVFVRQKRRVCDHGDGFVDAA